MTLNMESSRKPANRSEVAGVAINVVIALQRIGSALETLQANTGVEIGEEVVEIHKAVDKLLAMFDELTGWSEDGD